MGPSLEGRYHHGRHLMSQVGTEVESGAGLFILVTGIVVPSGVVAVWS